MVDVKFYDRFLSLNGFKETSTTGLFKKKLFDVSLNTKNKDKMNRFMERQSYL